MALSEGNGTIAFVMVCYFAIIATIGVLLLTPKDKRRHKDQTDDDN